MAASQTDVADVGQPLPPVPVRAEQLADARCDGRVSAVGTNHRPVSPKNVGNAGLVSVLVLWVLLAD